MKDGAIPTKNLPVKSRTSVESVLERGNSSITKQEFYNSELSSKPISPKPCYQDINNLVSKIKLIKANEWTILHESNQLIFKKMDGIHILPQIELYIDSDLFYTIRVFGWLLPETHDLYKRNKRSVKWVTIQMKKTSWQYFENC